MTFASSPADLAGLDKMREMSGLDFMQAMLSGEISEPPIAQGCNFSLESVDEGKVVFRGTPGFSHMNPMGGVHGGWYATILDSALGCAVMTRVPAGSTYTTLEFKVNLTRALPAETEVRAIGLVAHAGRSTGVATAELRGVSDDRLYATASTTCLVMALPIG
ncbi:PaaI family thioesterase [Palleronia sp. LCG004]|uniref:PaaI family thioesterase n=1 Tax=Palleronia sp. LCG004 TaxID=3079304 RepID=UPI002941C4CB|nr:PaaI family thioesterase [Palleronia sp. LCG004]WOI55146.1 PaaI family thioesterase [Palleronia sp. LCG004]